MIRRGRFARWKEKEYEISSRNKQLYLMTTNECEKNNGFTQMGNTQNALLRAVDVKELDDAYEIIPFAHIAGHRFAIEGIDAATGLVKLVTHNPFVVKKMNVHPYGNDAYMIELPFKKIEVEEDRIPILGFENKFV